MEHDAERVEGQDGCGQKRRIRSENWSAGETLQMLELRKGVVETLAVKGSGAWKQIAQELADMNPGSQARSARQVAQRWDTLVKVYVSVEEECCESGRTYGGVIDERQQRCRTEYREVWHELIAQGNPGKRRPGKAAVQTDEAPGSGGSQSAVTFVRKFGEIAESFTEILDTIERSISSSEGIRRLHENIVIGSNWESEDDQGFETKDSGSGLEKQQVETKMEVAKATQVMFDRMQTISEAASASGPFCLEVDQKDWSMVMQKLSAISQKHQEPSRDDVVGADGYVPNIQQRTNSASRSSRYHNNSTHLHLRPSSSLYTKTRKRKEKSSSFGKCHGGSTQSSTFAGLVDIVPLSPDSGLRGWRDELRDLDKNQLVPVFQETQ